MISPVSSDKAINTSTDQSGRSHSSQKTAETSAPSTTQQTQETQANSPTVEVDQARKLFDIENNRVETSNNTLQTPEQARSLVESTVQQIVTTPESAARAQAGNASTDPIMHILASAPA
ncbi:MAG: hypothetical protein PVI97_02400 [Candidatus Thiodiazotropha sp.]|jgi:hypothetical protein